MVICLERRADLHMSQLMPLPLADSCFSKIQIGFTFLVSAHLDSPGQSAVKRMCVCVCVPIWRSPPSWIFKNSKFYRSVSSSHSLHKLLVLNFKFYKVLEQCSECDSVTHTQRVFLGVCRNFFWKSVYICIGYCQKSNGLFFIGTLRHRGIQLKQKEVLDNCFNKKNNTAPLRTPTTQMMTHSFG